MIGNDGVDDVTILVNSSPDKLMGLNLSFANGFPSVSNAVLCAKASMLLQVRMLFKFHRISLNLRVRYRITKYIFYCYIYDLDKDVSQSPIIL